MSLRRAVGFLLTRRFSPRVIPRTAPARSIHSLRELPIGDGLRGAAGVAAAAAAFAGVGALALQYFKKGPDEEVKKGPDEEDMKARFEDWMKKYDKTYRDEEEKAMRFKLFKATVRWIESLPPSSQEKLQTGYFADFTEEESPWCRSCIDLDDPDSEEYRENAKFLAKYEKGEGEGMVWKPAVKQGDKQESLIWRPDAKQGVKRATQVSA